MDREAKKASELLMKERGIETPLGRLASQTWNAHISIETKIDLELILISLAMLEISLESILI